MSLTALPAARGAAAQDNMRGAAFMAAAMAGFVVNDALMKAVLVDLPLFQSILLRGVAATALLLALAWARGALRTPPRKDAAVLAWRSVGEIGATFCYLTALSSMPIANATAILQVMPLATTLAAAALLREPVGWRRWTAILVGFAGVMLIIRPGTSGFDASAFWALAAVCFTALRDLVTRRLSPATPSMVAALCTSATITLAAAFATLGMEDWRPVETGHALRLAAAACCIPVGYLCVVAAMRVGDVGFVAPFRYTILVYAMILGAVFFGEIPDPLTFVGAAVVVGAGVYAFRRELRLMRAKGR